MTDDESTTDGQQRQLETDGGHETVDYLDEKIHMFRPATPFMRDHLKLIWGLFAVWVVFTFGPVTATLLATDFMTGTHVLGFQLHYFLTAIGSPVSVLVLCAAYAWQRDRLDAEYGVSHETEAEAEAEAEAGKAVAADGGEKP
ncbi:DUF4212 domain-containing protein [Natronolimnohabitans sp. A-GB9]|uniref:DUF4212 domain-containing protein n=1 Tax=Natronolimnohabitans sp. A-GB9 TaxID=3069757 RepID=UPI0027B187C4|nr:DUF4212 domain-containing protein [Natronolimnohabitans sp. A-GB9]MDQ2050603.1 DUF4212 domain-containing protein [Natronolimnohabitans sp. A-GB9]